MRRAAVVAVAALLLTAGCGSDDDEPGVSGDVTPAVAVADAPQTYGDLARQLATSVAAALDTTTSARRSGAGYLEDHGVCQYWSSVYELPVWFGQDVSWDDVRGAIEDAVPQGWSLGDELDIPGGYQGFDVTEDATGATVEVRAKGTSSLRVGAPVEGDCPDS